MVFFQSSRVLTPGSRRDAGVRGWWSPRPSLLLRTDALRVLVEYARVVQRYEDVGFAADPLVRGQRLHEALVDSEWPVLGHVLAAHEAVRRDDHAVVGRHLHRDRAAVVGADPEHGQAREKLFLVVEQMDLVPFVGDQVGPDRRWDDERTVLVRVLAPARGVEVDPAGA